VAIQLLDQITVDKIAAGEVVERPASVVKELVENAIDAKSTSIVVEVKDGGISFLRVSDNGAGIPFEEVRTAFLRHSTSKIRSADDLDTIQSLGFRGEALSSISAVAQVELITKSHASDSGCKYRIEGGVEKEYEEVGAPNGTSFLVHQIFYNTPARRKFLKTPMTEASHIGELLNRLALSHPEISFQFINNGQSKLHTSGNGKLKDVIYHIYGRDIANNLLEVSFERNGIAISGYLGAPSISRGNRNYENYFINGRYVKNNTIYKAIEDGYKDFSMQHRYPFVVLQMQIDSNKIDVNVHPTKMELRFSNQQEIYNIVYEAICTTLYQKETVPVAELAEPPSVTDATKAVRTYTAAGATKAEHTHTAENTTRETTPVSVLPKMTNEPPKEETKNKEVQDVDYFIERMKQRVTSYHAENTETSPVYQPKVLAGQIAEEQISLFKEDTFLKSELPAYTLIGQLFETYWLVQVAEQLYIIDQHAAHERVLYEKTLHSMKTREYTTQYIEPPIVLDLSMQEASLFTEHMEVFKRIGFEIEEFGGDSYMVRGIPDNLFHIAKTKLLMEMIDELQEGLQGATTTKLIDEKIASMSCKAAVKGNAKLSAREMDNLLLELLKLENPYHCPHGRPVIISMSKRELEKKFKRIV
jgi:DNA mismatch repair protein MutL